MLDSQCDVGAAPTCGCLSRWSACSNRIRCRSDMAKTCGVASISSSQVTPTDHMSYGHVARTKAGLPGQYLQGHAENDDENGSSTGEHVFDESDLSFLVQGP